MNAFIGHFETESMPVAKVGFVIDKHDRLTVEGVAFRVRRQPPWPIATATMAGSCRCGELGLVGYFSFWLS